MNRLRLGITERFGLTLVWADPELPDRYVYNRERVNAWLTARNSERFFDAVEALGAPLLPVAAEDDPDRCLLTVPDLSRLQASELPERDWGFLERGKLEEGLKQAAGDLAWFEFPKDSEPALRRAMESRWYDGSTDGAGGGSTLYVEPVSSWFKAYKAVWNAALAPDVDHRWSFAEMAALRGVDGSPIGLAPELRQDPANEGAGCVAARPLSLYAMLHLSAYARPDGSAIKACKLCNRPFLSDGHGRRFCSDACKTQSHRSKEKNGQEAPC